MRKRNWCSMLLLGLWLQVVAISSAVPFGTSAYDSAADTITLSEKVEYPTSIQIKSKEVIIYANDPDYGDIG